MATRRRTLVHRWLRLVPLAGAAALLCLICSSPGLELQAPLRAPLAASRPAGAVKRNGGPLPERVPLGRHLVPAPPAGGMAGLKRVVYREIRFSASAPIEQRVRLQSSLHCVQPIGADRGVYRIPAGRLASLLRDPAIASVRRTPAEAKLSGMLRDGTVMTDRAGRVRVDVHYHLDADPQLVERRLSRAGLQIVRHLPATGVVQVRGQLSVLRQVARDDRVFQLWPTRTPGAANVNSARASRVNHLWTGHAAGFDLTGEGVTIACFDSGQVRGSHQDLDGVVDRTGGAPFADHSTHVAGTMIGTGEGDARARGMAPGAQLLSYGFGQPAFGPMGRGGYQVANNSWGFRAGWDWNRNLGAWVWFGPNANAEDPAMGKYTGTCRTADLATQRDNRIVVKAAGNDRGDTGPAPGGAHRHAGQAGVFNDNHPADAAQNGYDSLSPWASAKNPIVVGAVGNGLRQPTRFSSFGPTDDGRIKPDLMADGASVYSTAAVDGAGNGSDNSYNRKSGTSMASPVVSGTIALLVQQMRLLRQQPRYAPPLSLVKALLIQTARDLGPAGPDYRTGWGLVDARAAASLIRRNVELGNKLILHHQLSGYTVVRSAVELRAGQSFRITLAWSDPAAPGNVGGADDTTRSLINDLDLRILGPGGQIFRPYILDPARPARAATRGDNNRDNVEQIWIPSAPQDGTYFIYIRTKNRLAAPQKYSVAASRPLIGMQFASLSSPYRLHESVSASLDLHSGRQVHRLAMSWDHLWQPGPRIEFEVEVWRTVAVGGFPVRLTVVRRITRFRKLAISLNNPGEYYWAVRTRCMNRTSPWSSSRRIETASLIGASPIRR